MTQANSTTNSVAQIVTEQIVEGLKMGIVPWHKPWLTTECRNFATGHRYTGINTLLTAVYCIKNGWEHPLFASYKQIESVGGHVRKGEHGEIVVFAKTYTFIREPEPEDEEEVSERTIHVLRYYKVFNLAQTDLDVAKYVKTFAFQDIVDAETYLYARNPHIEHGGERACYNPETDLISLPIKTAFQDTAEYYLTAFHELTHWTGHKTRLDRLTTTQFGSGEYSQEELVAEIGANMASYHCGIKREVTQNSQAYINGWLSHLESDPKIIIRAASKAQKAYDYMSAGPEIPDRT